MTDARQPTDAGAWSHRPVAARVALFAIVTALLAYWSVVVRAPQPRLANSWTDPVSGIPFVLIRSGTFSMGSPPHERDRERQEVQHLVTLTRAFYLGIHEVTQAEWQKVMGSNPAYFKDCGSGCPVEQVSWVDAQKLIAKLNASGQPGFRLPTEAEWEYACRAGSGEAFGRSSTLSSLDANINGNYPYNAPKGVFRARPTAVGRFQPNGWGLFDISGNVWEWVQDWHCPYPETAVTDPVGSCTTELRVIRGGSWLFDGNSARCSLRYTHRPQDGGYSLGLRLAHDVW